MQCLAALMLLYTSFLMNLAFSLNLNPRSLLTQCHCTTRMSKFKQVAFVFSLSRNPSVSLQEVQLLLSKISAARHCTSLESFLFYLMVTSLLCFIYLFLFLFTLNGGGKGCLLKPNFTQMVLLLLYIQYYYTSTVSTEKKSLPKMLIYIEF